MAPEPTAMPRVADGELDLRAGSDVAEVLVGVCDQSVGHL
jgi:hypothetical protein